MRFAVQGSMHEVVKGFVATFRHEAATADSLLCHLAARLSSVPVSTLHARLAACQDALPGSAAAAGAESAGNGTAIAAGSLQAAGEWLERLQAWQTFPGVPLLRVDQEPATQGTDESFEALQLKRERSPWLVRSLCAWSHGRSMGSTCAHCILAVRR